MSEFEEERFSKKVWPENRISELIRILEPLCIEYVKATHILHDLPFLRAHAGLITKAERRFAQEGTKLLLEFIKDSDEPEKWKTFTLALKRAVFLSLYKVCHVCEKNDDFDFYIDIFELLSMDFASNGVDIVNLSQGMLQSESLTKEQFEQINFVLKVEGEIAAILEFFSCLPSSLEIWLKALQSCLFVLNKGDLYKLIQKKGAEIDSFKNIDLGPLVKIYYNTICERVRPQDIKAYLNPYNLIPDMNVNSLSPCEEMRRILENIDRSKVDGKWRSFLNALKQTGYESLHTKLTNEEENIDDSQQMCILKNVTPEILKSLSICNELLSEVKRDKLINERCYQEIKKKQDSGEIAAAEMLLESIPRFKDGWFKRFLQILTNVGQRNVVKKIDPDFQYFSDTGKVVEVEGKSC